MNRQSWLGSVAVALSLSTLGACSTSSPSNVAMVEGDQLAVEATNTGASLLTETSDPRTAVQSESPRQRAETQFSGDIERLPFSSRFGRLTGLWVVDDTRVFVTRATELPPDSPQVGDTVQVTGQAFGALVIASAVNEAGIQLTSTVPQQTASGLQISVQIPFSQLTTSFFTIDGEVIPPDSDPIPTPARFVRIPVDIFPGFTSYIPDGNSPFVEVAFDQLVVPNVPSDTCVIVHQPGTDPSVPINQIALAEGCN